MIVYKTKLSFKFFSLYNAARDMFLRVEEARKRHPNLKCFLYGGSMGGLIAILMAKAGIAPS